MGWFGDLIGAVLPIAGGAFLGPWGAVGGSLLGGAINGGGGSGTTGFNLAQLAPYLSGMATAQRIPGQTQPGSYTPEPGGYGTYNYIPTGAETLDPALISLLQGNLGTSTGVSNTATPLNLAALNNILGINSNALRTSTGAAGALLNQSTANPFTDALVNASRNAGTMSDRNATQQQDWGRGLANTGGSINGMFQNLMSRAGSNPFTNSMVSGAQNAGQRFQNVGTWLGDYTAGGIQNLDNPFYGQQLTGAQTGGNMLQAGGANAFGQGQTYANTAAGGLPAISSILSTAFDPQTALYNREATKNQDQIAAYLARSGLTNSGAGAGIASDAITNFNLGWGDRQLGRQTAGVNAFGSGLQSIGNGLTTGANLSATGAGNYATGAGLPATTLNQQTGARFDLSSKGAQALGAAEGLNLAGTQIPYQAYDTTTGDFAKYLGQYANALPAIGGAYTTGSNLLDRAVQSEYNAGAIPYGAVQMNNADNWAALGNYNNNMTTAQNFSGLPSLNAYLSNAGLIGNLTNQPAAQISDYLRLVLGGSQIAGNNASGAQTNTNAANANAAGALNPLITGGLNGLSSLINGLFSSGGSYGSGGPGWLNSLLYPARSGSTLTPYGNQIFG
jgi:hypothetical protein